MAWNAFKIDSSKIGVYQNFLIYCDKFDNKIIYCLSRFRAGNFSPAPTSSTIRIHIPCHEIKAKERLSESAGIKPALVNALILRQTAHYQK